MAVLKTEIKKGKILWGNEFTRAYVEGDDRLAALFEYFPASMENLVNQARKLASMDFPRKAVSKRAHDYAIECGAGERSLANAANLANPKTLAVVVGQQPCFMTGPLYVIYKAITAIKLSAMLSSELAQPVVPVFWNGSDDHDLTEVNHIYYPHSSGPRKAALDVPPERRMMSHFFPGDANKLIQKLEFIPREWREFMNFLPGESLSHHFSRLMFRLFQKHGLVILEPRQFSDFNAPIVRADLDSHLEIHELLNQASQAIISMGFIPQLDRDVNTMNYFLIRDGIRDPVPETETTPDHPNLGTSLNVLLRPVLQHSIMPVVAHVTGPGEIGYHAQMQSLQQFFKVYQPVIWPRQSCTLVTPAVARVAERFELDLEQLFWSPERIKEKLPRPAGLDKGLESADRDITRILEKISEDVVKIDPTLDGPAQKTRRNITSILSKFRDKALKAWHQKEGLEEGQLQKLRVNVMPNKRLQERVFNIFFFLNSYGYDLIDEILERCDPLDFRHKAIWLG